MQDEVFMFMGYQLYLVYTMVGQLSFLSRVILSTCVTVLAAQTHKRKIEKSTKKTRIWIGKDHRLNHRISDSLAPHLHKTTLVRKGMSYYANNNFMQLRVYAITIAHCVVNTDRQNSLWNYHVVSTCLAKFEAGRLAAYQVTSIRLIIKFMFTLTVWLLGAGDHCSPTRSLSLAGRLVVDSLACLRACQRVPYIRTRKRHIALACGYLVSFSTLSFVSLSLSLVCGSLFLFEPLASSLFLISRHTSPSYSNSHTGFVIGTTKNLKRKCSKSNVDWI